MNSILIFKIIKFISVASALPLFHIYHISPKILVGINILEAILYDIYYFNFTFVPLGILLLIWMNTDYFEKNFLYWIYYYAIWNIIFAMNISCLEIAIIHNIIPIYYMLIKKENKFASWATARALTIMTIQLMNFLLPSTILLFEKERKN